MALDPVATGRIELELNDDALVQGLQRVQREHERTMREIDKSRAEATVDVDTSPYDDAIKNVRRELKELDGKRVTGELDMDDDAFKKKVRKLRNELKDLEGQKATIELELRGEDEFKKASKRAQKAAQKDIEATEKRLERRERLYQQAAQRRERLLIREGNLHLLAQKREADASRAREQAFVREGNVRLAMKRRADQVAAAEERAAAIRQREIDSIPKLRREYADLTTKMEQLAVARRKAFPDKHAQFLVDLKVAETTAKMQALVKELERIGGDVDVRLNFKTGAALGAQVRKSIMAGGGLTGAGYIVGKGMGMGILRGVQDTLSPKNMLARTGNIASRFGQLLGSLSEASVRIGPFTASLRTLMIALTVLGPTILDLVGALGALVGVLGTGLVGAGALGAGALSAFGVALGGVGFLIPSLLKDFKNLTTLQDAYHKSVLKLGENAGKTKTKLEEFEHALGEVQPTTKEAFLSIDKLSNRWNKMAQDVKPQFFDAMGASLEVVNHHFEWFADNTKRSFTILSEEWQEWMKGLQGDEAGSILKTLGKNGRESLRPLMEALGNLLTWFGRVSAEASNYLPGLLKQFQTWSKGVADGVGPMTNLSEGMSRLVEHTRSLGRFLMSTTRFLVSFFDSGADAGQGFLDTMSDALDGWTRFNESVEGRAKLEQFFERSVKGAQALYKALEPLVTTFVAWASQMSPLVTGFLEGAAAVTGFVGSVVKLVGLQSPLSALVTTLGALWAVGRIKAATTALIGFSGALTGTSVAASATGAASSGGLLASMLGLGGRGASAGRIIGPAERTLAGRLRTIGFGAVKKAGLIGVGIAAMELVVKGLGTAQAREGVSSTMMGLSRDVMNSLTLGIIDSADEKSAEAAKYAVDALRKNMNLELDKNMKIGPKKDSGSWLTFSIKDMFNDTTSTDDLTKEARDKLETGLKAALKAADDLVKQHQLPALNLTIRQNAKAADLQTIQNNWNRLQNNLASTNANIRKNTDETLAAMSRSMDLTLRPGITAVARNMALSADAIKENMTRGTTSVHDGMMEIRHQFKVHSQAAKRSADQNFGAARAAIEMAVKDGALSSKRGLAEIRKLWVTYLGLYGFTEQQAKNEVKKGTRFDAGPDEGTRGVRGASGSHARGGLINIGTPGTKGHDTVPMNLGGVPSIVAPGEQIAVFNRHQQKAIGGMVPGGLEGFFATHRKPHYAATGGIVPVPGFPGESAASGVISKILWIARTFGLILTDAYGQGHKSPGHTQTGTAADFAGSDRAMDAAVRALVAQGYLVGYDGRYGSADWPGHGPAAGQGGGNAHLHVELSGAGAGGGSIEAQTIARQMAPQGLGMVSLAVQAVLDSARAAAQANLNAVAASSLSVATAGGQGIAVNDKQVKAWIAAGLRLAGQAATDGAIATLYGRVMQESGGNPRAQNNWDSNAKAGHPSKGILQTIDSTFDAYKVKGYDDIWNPVHNIAAAVRYMMARYGHLVGRSSTGYALGGLVDTMGQAQWARGGKVERPTLMTGEDGRRAPEYIVGTNPAFRKTNLQALTNAASALGVPMARKSKTGTIKPTLALGQGRDPDNLREVKDYAKIQQQENDKRREISIAESKVKEPDTLIKQQGTDGAGNPLYVVDQAKLDSYVSMMDVVQKLYDDMMRIMESLMQQARRAYEALDRYRAARTQNIAVLNAQNAINKRLMKSKDEHTAEAAKRRYEAGIDMRGQQVQLRNDAEATRTTIRDDQKDAAFRVQEYDISRQSVKDDIAAVGTKAAADALSETKSAFKEPETPPDLPSPGESAVSRLETELALSRAGYNLQGGLGGARATADIINDLIAANQTVITEAQTLLNDADPENDKDAYSAITRAAGDIKGLRDELDSDKGPARETQFHTFGNAMLDLYRSFGSNVSGGNAAAQYLSGGMGAAGASSAGRPAAGAVINIEQNFPTQPDPMTWAVVTRHELNAAL